jgi:uncharacterized protein (DUF58 family)
VRPTSLAVGVFGAGALLAVLTAALWSDMWAWWLAFVFAFAGLLGLDALLAPALARLAPGLEAPERLRVGARQAVRLELGWRGRPIRLGRLALEVRGELDEPPEQVGIRLSPGQNAFAFELEPRRRGRVAVEAAWVRAHGPLGLVALTRRLELGRELPVHPDLKLVGRRAARLGSRGQAIGARVERHRGDGSEFDSLREYVPGFDIRSLDWKASARHARLLCREFRAERNRQVVLAVDAGRLMAEPLGGLPRLDHAIHAALVLAYVSLAVGDRVGLVSFDDRLRQHCNPVRGPGAFGELSAIASRIDYSPEETNFTLGLMELARRQPRRALVVVLTDFVDTITAELMLDNLSRLSRRHQLIFVALSDPLLAGICDRRPAAWLDVERAVVGQHLLRDRELVLRRLQRLGIACVDAAPDRVSAELVERYLTLKRREAF